MSLRVKVSVLSKEGPKGLWPPLLVAWLSLPPSLSSKQTGASEWLDHAWQAVASGPLHVAFSWLQVALFQGPAGLLPLT